MIYTIVLAVFWGVVSVMWLTKAWDAARSTRGFAFVGYVVLWALSILMMIYIVGEST